MALNSWVTSANNAQTDFPLANLPFGVFRQKERVRIGVAIGDQILDLHACAELGLLNGLAEPTSRACRSNRLNDLMALGSEAWRPLRKCVSDLLRDDAASAVRQRVAQLLVPGDAAEMLLPAEIGDYTDFYASIHHATRVGKRLRPDCPLLPNYKYVPVGYHGRASSIVESGTAIRRPFGQTKGASATEPTFGPSRSLDFELEVGIFVGPGNSLGEPIPIATAEDHIFGLCLLNDWSARDIQGWEYQPLGPFLAKNFATSISPWVVTLEALEPYRVQAPGRPLGDPAPLTYLAEPVGRYGGFDVTLEVFLQSEQMQKAGHSPMMVSRSNMRHLYWTVAQLVTHHASNGCNLRAGDLCATGTASGPESGSECCLLEKLGSGDGVKLPSGEIRRFLEDGDTVTLRASAQREGLPTIGFGECAGTIMAASERLS